MGKVLALTFWSLFAVQGLWWRSFWPNVAGLAAYPITFVGLALCYSRAGYLTLVAVGLVLGCLRWRKLLLLVPLAIVLVVMFMPAVADRMLMGFDHEPQKKATSRTDWNEVTAGRTGNLWPPIIEEIEKAPFFGHGRLAILHTPAYDKILATEDTVPTTPHNGYLEVMVDTGAIGLAIVLSVFLGVAALSYRLMRRRDDQLARAVGTVGLVHTVGCLVNALSGGVLLPNQGMLGTFCVFGMVLRTWYIRIPATVEHSDWGLHNAAYYWWQPQAGKAAAARRGSS
jgi:O-antigen ligase